MIEFSIVEQLLLQDQFVQYHNEDINAGYIAIPKWKNICVTDEQTKKLIEKNQQVPNRSGVSSLSINHTRQIPEES